MSCLYLYCGLLTRGSGLFVVQELANLVFISIPWPPYSWVGYVCCSGTRQSCVYIYSVASLLVGGYVCCSGTRQSCVYIYSVASLLVGRVCLLFRNSPILCLYTYHGLLTRGSGMFVVQEPRQSCLSASMSS